MENAAFEILRTTISRRVGSGTAPSLYCAGEIIAAIVLTMMMNQTPHWRTIASSVKTSQPTLCAVPAVARHTQVAQATSAATGMRQNSATIKPSGGAGKRNRFSNIREKT